MRCWKYILTCRHDFCVQLQRTHVEDSRMFRELNPGCWVMRTVPSQPPLSTKSGNATFTESSCLLYGMGWWWWMCNVLHRGVSPTYSSADPTTANGRPMLRLNDVHANEKRFFVERTNERTKGEEKREGEGNALSWLLKRSLLCAACTLRMKRASLKTKPSTHKLLSLWKAPTMFFQRDPHPGVSETVRIRVDVENPVYTRKGYSSLSVGLWAPVISLYLANGSFKHGGWNGYHNARVCVCVEDGFCPVIHIQEVLLRAKTWDSSALKALEVPLSKTKCVQPLVPRFIKPRALESLDMILRTRGWFPAVECL